MKIQINKQDLCKLLTTACIDEKKQNCVMLTAKDGKLEVQSFDFRNWLKLSYTAEVLEEGACVVPYKALKQAVSSKTSGHYTLSLEDEKLSVIDSFSLDTTVLRCLDVESFALGDLSFGTNYKVEYETKMPSNILLEAINACSPHLSTDKVRWNINCLHLEGSNMSALNGYSVATYKLPDSNFPSLLLNPDGVKALASYLENVGSVTLSVLYTDWKKILVVDESLYIAVEDAVFPDWKKIEQNRGGNHVTVTFDVSSLKEHIKKLAKTAYDHTCVITKEAGKEYLTLYSSHEDKGETSIKVNNCCSELEDFKIAFSLKLLSSVLASLPKAKDRKPKDVIFEVGSPSLACKVYPFARHEDMYWLVMPMRV